VARAKQHFGRTVPQRYHLSSDNFIPIKSFIKSPAGIIETYLMRICAQGDAKGAREPKIS
jgi:hypothetical protein